MARRRSAQVVAAGTAAFAVLALSGCGSDPDPDYHGVCMDKKTQVRTDDKKCKDGGGGSHGFVYIANGNRYPAVGQSMSGYSHVSSVPKGHVGVKGGASTTGGTVSKASAKAAVSRGGFGTTSKGGGSVGG